MHIGSGTDLEHLAEVAGALERVAIEIGRSLTTGCAGGSPSAAAAGFACGS